MFETWAKTIGEALLNSLWQGTALTLLACLLLRLNRRASASARYVVCAATLAAVLALPVLQLVRPAALPAGNSEAGAPSESELVDSYTPLPAVSVPSAAPHIRFPLEVPAGSAASLLVILWLALASLFCIRLALAYRALQCIKSEASAAPAPYDRWWRRWLLFAPSARKPQLRSSNRICLPLTAGLREPAIVFPASLLDKLTEQEARTIWLHELAHVRRLDDWTKLGQKLIEALLFFHPAVRWLGRQLEIEREIACDDWVVRQTGAPRPYAACLAKLAAYASPRPSASPAPAMAADKKQIFRRVKMIIDKNQETRKTESRASGILIAVFLLAVAGAMVAADPILVFADAQTEDAPPTPPTPPTAAIADVVPPAPPAAPAARAAARPVPAVVPVPPPPPASTDARPVLAAVPAPPLPPASADAQPVLAAVPAPPAPPPPPQEPAAAPNPQPRPAPKPVVAPKPNPHPHPEMDAEVLQQLNEIRAQMAEKSEEMRALSDQIRKEVQANLEPHREEMQRMAREIRETVQAEMRPRIDEIRETARALEKEHLADLPDEARLAELNEKMAELELQLKGQSEVQVHAFEEQMRELEKQMKPSEEVLRKFEEQMRQLELEMNEKSEQMRQFEREKFREKGEQQNGHAPI